ncbi:MAG: PD40 domain-containing protein [Chloroflexi bacterium]|nr:PD40 domain-containing protein [Chloroflexota bacterium]
MIRIAWRSAAAGVLLWALLLVGARALGAALPSSGEMRYVLQSGIETWIPYAYDVDHGINVQMLPLLAARLALWLPDSRYLFCHDLLRQTCMIDWQSGQSHTLPGLIFPRALPEGAAQLIYDAPENGSGYQRIYRASAPDFVPQALTPPDEYNYYHPMLSPNGALLTFEGRATGVSEVFVMNADGSRLRSLTNGQWVAFNPAWSPDGRFVAFRTLGEERTTNLAVVELTNNTVQMLTPDTIDVPLWQWSPDSTRLAAVTQTFERGYQIEIVTLDGERQAWPSPYDMHYGVMWSPDSRSLLLLSGQIVANTLVTFAEFWQVENGQVAQRIVDLYNAVWSPDGETMAYGTVDGDLCFLRPAGWQTRCTRLARSTIANVVWLP